MKIDAPNEGSGTATNERSSHIWPLMLLLLVAAAALVAIQMRRPKPPNPLVGLALPPVSAEGWLNTDRPLTLEDLHGNVVLVDFWATNCVPCWRDTPDLIKLHERFRDHGLKIVSLTHESGDQLPQVEQFIEKEKIDWPIGYGAGFAFEMMQIQLTPTYLLYGRDGVSTWGGHSLDGLDEAIVAALAK